MSRRTHGLRVRSGVVTDAEARALLGCGRAWLCRLIQRGDLRRVFTGRRLPTGQAERGVSRASLKALLAARGKSSAAVEPSATVFVERVASGGSEPVRRSVARVIIDIVVEAP